MEKEKGEVPRTAPVFSRLRQPQVESWQVPRELGQPVWSQLPLPRRQEPWQANGRPDRRPWLQPLLCSLRE